MKQTHSKALLLAMALAASANASASSHREAPFIAQNPAVDATDFYMFNSYESGREDYVTLIANYNPLQDPFGGPNYFALSSDALYEIEVDNNGDGIEDITFQFQFQNKLANDGNGLTVPALGQDVAVPLKNIGGISSTDNAAQNFLESYSVKMVTGDRRTGTKHDVIGSGGATTFAKPIDNVGGKTFGSQTYADYANTFIHDVTLSACPSGAQNGRIFVGQRKESFAANVGKIFDLVNLNPLGPVDGESNPLEKKNITTFALEVPKACLTGGNENGIIGAWTTASLPQVRVLDPKASFSQTSVNGGAWTQVSRLSMPLVNEVVIGLPDKNKFNGSEPKDDPQFLKYVTNPTLPTLLNVLFNVTPPTNEGRDDLVAAFLTGIDGVNKNGSVGEMQRLNTTIPAVGASSQQNLGVAAGDNAGFPNGRRPGDDVVDASLRVAMGLLCKINVGCTPEQAPSGDLAYTDGVLQEAAQFDETFPYLKTPLAGSDNY